MNTLDQQLRPCRRMLIGHGALLILAAGVIGFCWLFFIIGEISLWPIPGKIDYQFPGTMDSWRMAHLEALMNGTIVWMVAAILPLIPLSVKALKRTAYSIVIVAWSIVIASTLDPLFPESRGLIPSSSVTNNLAFGLFFVGIALVMGLMSVIAFKALRREDPSSE